MIITKNLNNKKNLTGGNNSIVDAKKYFSRVSIKVIDDDQKKKHKETMGLAILNKNPTIIFSYRELYFSIGKFTFF